MRTVTMLLCLLAVSAHAGSRVFEFTYEMPAAEFPPGETVDVYIPLPSDMHGQQVLAESLQSTPPGEVATEAVYGNRFYRITRPANSSAPVAATLTFTVSRATVTAGEQQAAAASAARYLAPRVRLSSGVL